MELKLLLTLALVAYSSAGPITNQETCSRKCTDTKKFGYTAGRTYEYDYTSNVDTSIQGASEDKSGLQLTAKVYIDVVSKCEMNLRLGNVRLLESDPKDPKTKVEAESNGEFKRSLEESSLAFSFQDGRIEELCTSRPEKTWVLNIKRGILSSVQNSMTDFTQDQQIQEADVTGECKAEYKVSSDGWYSRTIKKSKDLLACVNRHGYNTVMQGTPYRVPSEIQSLPLVKSTHECTQDISKQGILQSSICEEHHVLRPFSRESSGAVTKTTQSLKYVTDKSSTSNVLTIGERVPMTFSHASDDRGALTDMIGKLNEICVSTTNRVRPETPKLFSDLVHLMKALDSDDLPRIYAKIQSSSFCPANQERVLKFFLDALPMAGNRASLKMMTDLIKNKRVTGVEADMWLTTLSFIKDPSKDMLNEVKPLLSSEVNGKVMLGVSSLINAYCKSHACENDMDIVSMVSSIADKIGVGCYVDKNNLNTVILSLRALGNAGYVSSALPIINTCISKRDNPTEVRLAAIQSFRRMPCSAEREEVASVFKNRDEDSELRIAAYLALMTCPSEKVMSRVRYLLETEEVNQVGSFIWSHLTNMMETSSPLKQDIRTILNNDQLKKEFNLDKLKYSRNYEASFFLEKLNIGASVDSNLVWSSKSFLPRSAMTNMTVDLFGHSVNFLEIGGRLEGLEYFLESYFGPNGYFQDKEAKEVVKQSLNGISERKMDNIDRQFGSEMDALKGDLYMRVFGNELMFTRFTGLSDLTDAKSINIMDILDKLARNQQYTYTQNYMFLDSSIIIPTVSGFPLNLTIEGSATIDLEASGKMDLRGISKGSPTLAISGYIKPSGSILINSMMSVDAFVTKSGMKMMSTMHSSTSLEGHVELANGKVLSAELKTPFDNMEIFNVKTSFFTIHRQSEREQKMITDNRQVKKTCSGDMLSKITGMELCAELQYPNASLKADSPYFPLTGPLSAAISLNKRDSHSSYIMEYKFVMDQQEGRARVAFNTPGSKVDREMSLDFIIRSNEPMVEMNMVSPWKKASIRGALVGDNGKKQMTGRLLIDNKEEYSVTAEWARTRKGNLYTYNPFIEIVIPNKENIRLSSNVEYNDGKSFDGELIVKGLSKHPINSKVSLVTKNVMTSLKSSISFKPGQEYSFETRLQKTETKKAIKLMPFLSVRTPKEEVAAFGGSLEYKSGSLILVDLTLDRLLDKPIKIYTKFGLTSKKFNSRLQSKIDISTPIFRTKGQSNFVLQKKAIVIRTSLDYVIPGGSRDRITLNSKFNYAFTKSVWTIKGTGSVNFKRNDDYNVDVSTVLLNKERLTKVDLDLRYGAKKADPNKRIYISTNIKHQLAWRASAINLKGDIQHLASGLDLKFKGSHSHNKKSIDSTIGLVYGKKRSVSASVMLKNKSKRFTVVDGDASLKWNDKEFSLKNSFEQKNKRKFRNELSSNIAGYKTNVNSDIKMDDDEYEINTDITNAQEKPVHVEVAVNLNPRNFKIRSLLNKDYSISFGSQYKKNNLLRVSGDVSVPLRRVTAQLETQKKNTVYSSLIDVNWDANSKTDNTARLATELSYNSMKDFSGFIDVRSPLQNNKLNINRKDENAHFDFKNNGQEQISVNALLKQSQNQLITSLTVQSPFQKLRYVKVDVDHLSDADQYKTNLDVNWKPTNKISAVWSLQKPASLRQLHSSFDLKTPIDGFESFSINIDHDVKEGLKSTLKTEFNKKSINIDASAKKENEIFAAHAGIRSDLPLVKSIALDITHQTSGNSNENSIILGLNGDLYKYEGQLTHDRVGIMVQQNARILLLSPMKRYEVTWRHRNTRNEISSELMGNINGDIYKTEIDGTHTLSWNVANLEHIYKYTAPSGNGQLSVTHSHKDGTLHTVVKLSENERNVLTSDSHLQIQNGEVSATSTLIARSTQIFALENVLKTGNTKSLKIIISTPLKALNRLSTLVEFTGDLKSFSSSIITEIVPIMGEVKLVSTFDSVRGISGNVKLVTPFDNLPSSEVTFSQQTKNDKLNTDIKIEYLPKNVISISNSMLFNNNKLDTDMSIETPFEALKRLNIGISHTQTSKGSDTQMRMEYPAGKTYSAVLKNSYNDNFDSSLVIRRPDSHQITANIKHKGSLQQFVSGADLQYNADGIHKVDVSFTNGRNTQVRLNVQSPLINTVSASFSHNGDLEDMNSEIMMQYGKQKPVKVSLDFVSAKRIKGNFKATSPFTDDITAMISHKGTMQNFRSKVRLGWGKDEDISGDLSFSFTNNLKADFSLTTPVRNFRKMSAAVTHEGSRDNFKCHSEVRIGKDLWDANIVSKMNPIISSEIVIRTPHQGYESVKVAFTHDGQLSDFTCRLELSKEKQEITGDLKFKVQPFAFSSSLKTPFENYRNVRVVASHKGVLSKFETNAEITYSDSKTVVVKAILDTERSVMASLDINTPFRDFEDMTVRFTHSGDWSKCLTNIKSAVGKQSIEGKLELNTQRDILINFELRTPFEMIQMSKLSINHQGSIDNFKNHAVIEVNSKRAESDVTFSLRDEIQGSAKITTPFQTFSTAELLFKHRGNVRDFECSGEYMQDGKKTDAQLTVITTRGLSVRGSMRSPFSEDIVVKINHDGQIRSFQTTTDLVYGYKTVSSSLVVDTLKSLKIDATLKTPFMEDIIFSTETIGNPTNFKSHSELTYSGQKHHDITVVFQHDGDIRSFSTAADVMYNNKQSIGNMAFDSKSGYEVRASLKTPMTEDIIAHVKQVGTLLNFNIDTELTYQGRKQHELNIGLSHKGSIRNFQTNLKSTYNRKNIIGSVSFDASSDIRAKAQLLTPFTKDLVVSFTHKGELKNFNSLLEVEYGFEKIHSLSAVFKFDGEVRKFESSLSTSYNRNTISSDIVLDVTGDPEGRFNMKTPFTDDISASFRHQGVINNFLSHGELHYSGNKQHEIDIAFQNYDLRKFAEIDYNRRKVSLEATLVNGKEKNGRVALKTPFTEDIILTAEFSGDLMNFNSKGSLDYAGKNQHSGSLSFEHNGDIYNFRTTADIDYNNKKVSTELDFDSTNGIKTNGILRTPFTGEIRVSADINGNLNDFSTRSEITYSGSKQHEIVTSYKTSGTLRKFQISGSFEYNSKQASIVADIDTISRLSANIHVQTPYWSDIQIDTSLAGEPKNFEYQGEITYSGRKQHAATGKFNFGGDLRKFSVSAKSSYNGEEMSADVQWDTTYQYIGQIVVKTPYTEDITVVLKHKGDLRDFVSNMNVDYSGKRQHELKGTFKLDGKLKDITATGIFSYNNQEIVGRISLQTGNGIFVQAKLETPFTKPIKAEIESNLNMFDLTSRAMASYSGSTTHELLSKMKHTGELKQFRSEVLFSYNGNAISSDISFDITNGVQSSVDMRSPYADLKISVSHVMEGTMENMRTTTVLSLNGKEINVEIQLDRRNGLNGQVKVGTPFSSYESNVATVVYSHKGSICKLEGRAQIGQYKSQLNGLLDRTNGIRTEICIKTPFTEDFEILLNAIGNVHAFNYQSSVSYGVQKVKTNFNHEWTVRSMKGTVLLVTPILEDVQVEYDISGDMQSFESTATAFIGKQNGIKEITKVRLGNKLLNFDSSITTTLEGNPRTSQLNIMHSGDLSNFRTSWNAQSDEKEIKLVATFKRSPSVEAMFNLQTPFDDMHDISGKLEHSGSLKSFLTTSSFQYAPDKKIEGNARINMDRLNSVNINIDVQSPCLRVPQFTWRYMHNIKPESVEASTYIAPESNRPLLNGNLKITSKHIDISVVTPKTRYDVKGDVAFQSGTYTVRGNVARGSDKIVLNLQKSPSTLSVTLDTPFKDLERTQLTATAIKDPVHIAFNMQGTFMSDIDFETKFNKRDLEGSLKLKSGFKHLNDIRMNLKSQEILDGKKARIEAFINQLEGMVADLSVSKGEASTSIQTPWDSFRSLEATLKLDTSLSTTLTRNGEIVYDIELSADRTEKSLIINVNAPKEMRFEISKLGSKETFILVNWNKNDRDSSCRLDSKFNEDYSLTKKIVSFKGTCGTKSYGLDASDIYSQDTGTLGISLLKDDVITHRLQLENNRRHESHKVALQLPARTLVYSKSEKSTYGRKIHETSFSWDADKDLDKRVTFRKSGDEGDMKLELEMPSIGKDVKVDTQMRIGRGNVIYDGRTEFKYSKDSRKTLTLSSKLEDVSGRGEKYNFLLGINHPYTTVDVQTKAEFEKSDDKISAALDIQYLTARRQKKNFALMTEINRLRKQLNVEIRSPLKSMTMEANVETAPYKLSIKNVYDNIKPINTELLVDPQHASLDFSMNYDIDNPRNTLHVQAKLSDQQGIKAELYRDENEQKIVDSLLNIRLKTSKILNTRVQWRPSLLSDLKDALVSRAQQYRRDTRLVLDEAFEDIRQEISYKNRIFSSAYAEEMKSYQETVNEILEELRILRDRNDYHLGDIYKSTEHIMVRVVETADELNEAWKQSALKERIDRSINKLEDITQKIKQLSSTVYIPTGDDFVNIGSTAYNTVLESTSSIRKHPTMASLKSKYDIYLNQINQIKDSDQLVNIAQQWVPNVRETINKNLVHTLPTPVYSMGSSAYTFWEVEDNVRALMIKGLDEIKEDFLKEMSGLTGVLKNVMKSRIIAYDLQKGEIEFDIYLPADVRSLSSIADISLRQYMPQMSLSLPETNMLGSFEDYIPHMSWTGRAEIDGEHFRTFDGQEFDFSGRCSYILARDFVNGNFSVILNYIGRQNKKLIITAHSENVQLTTSGKIRVNNQLTDTPYKSSDFAVFSDEQNVVIEGRGFQVKADKALNKIDIDLSKWYFGRTGGLLGTLNHERYDDMMMPNKQITTDAFALGNAWQVQDRCR